MKKFLLILILSLLQALRDRKLYKSYLSQEDIEAKLQTMEWDENRNRMVLKEDIKKVECELSQSPHYQYCKKLTDCEQCTEVSMCGWCTKRNECYGLDENKSTCPNDCADGWIVNDSIFCEGEIKSGHIGGYGKDSQVLVSPLIAGLKIAKIKQKALKQVQKLYQDRKQKKHKELQTPSYFSIKRNDIQSLIDFKTGKKLDMTKSDKIKTLHGI